MLQVATGQRAYVPNHDDRCGYVPHPATLCTLQSSRAVLPLGQRLFLTRTLNPETLIPVLSLDSWHSVRECGPDAPGQCELHKGSAPCNSNNRNPGPQRQQMSWGWSLDQVYMTSMQEVKMRVGVWHGLARKLHPRVPPVSFLLNVLAPTYT